MKRQLTADWKEIIDFINKRKEQLCLVQFIDYFRCPTKGLKESLKKIYPFFEYTHSDESMDSIIPIITDIYNDNYELKEPKYYWRLNLQGVSCTDYYAVRIESLNGRFGLDKYKYDESKFTENELIDALSNTDTNLAINDFIPVEV